MVFNISNFASKVGSTGLAKSNLFVANISSPASMNLPIQSDLQFLCKTVSIPGMEVSTTDIQPQGWGRTDSYATNFTKQNLSMIFMVDSDFAVTQYLHRWMQSIVNFNDVNGTSSVDGSNKRPYEFGFRDNYSGTIQVIVFSEKDPRRNYVYQFSGTFPVSLSGIDISWENNAEIMTITASFSYTSMAMSGMQDTKTVSSLPPSSGFASGDEFSGLSGAISNASERFFGVSNFNANIQNSIDQFLGPVNNIVQSGREFSNALPRFF